MQGLNGRVGHGPGQGGSTTGNAACDVINKNSKTRRKSVQEPPLLLRSERGATGCHLGVSVNVVRVQGSGRRRTGGEVQSAGLGAAVIEHKLGAHKVGAHFAAEAVAAARQVLRRPGLAL